MDNIEPKNNLTMDLVSKWASKIPFSDNDAYNKMFNLHEMSGGLRIVSRHAKRLINENAIALVRIED